MRIGEIIGSVTLSRCHPSLRGARWRIVVPLDQAGLRGSQSGRGEPFVLFDELGSGEGSLVAISVRTRASRSSYVIRVAIARHAAGSRVRRATGLAPRVGVEPTSLVLIQSQAGPAGRPTGDRCPSLGPASGGAAETRQTNRG